MSARLPRLITPYSGSVVGGVVGAERGPGLTVRDRILVHLAEVIGSENGAQVPAEITQTGLARAAGIEQRHVAQYVRPLVKEGLVVERMAHVRGGKQRRRTYFLTPQGRNEAGRLRGNILGIQVEVELEQGRLTMSLREAAKGPLKGAPLLDLFRALGTEGLLRVPKGPVVPKCSTPQDLPLQVVGVAYPAALGPPLVDRSKEMQRLRWAVEELKAGRGGCLMLVGEAGIGKSRLALEVSALASQGGIPFLMGQATEYGGTSSLAPWTEALRALVHATPPSLLRDLIGPYASVLSRILPDLPARLGLAPLGPAAAAELERFQLFEAVTQFLVNASRARPLVLFLDDLQWADEATIQLLAYMNRNAASERILFLGSYRSEEVTRDGPLEGALQEIQRRRRLEQIRLDRLGPEDIRRLMVAILETERVDAKLTSAVVDRAGGNPLFTEELALTLREEGHIIVRGGEATWSGGAAQLPSTMQRLIRRRLARLSHPCQELLLRASVMGQRMRPEALATMSGLQWERLLDLVDEALASGFLVENTEGPEGELLFFSDELVRQCVYESITGIRRRSYHQRTAEVLAELPRPSAEELAHHYVAAGLAEPARHHLEAAGDEAMALSSFRRATDRFGQALRLWPEEDRQGHRRLLVKLGDAYTGAGKLLEARETYTQARRYADSPTDEAAIGVRLSDVLLALWDAPALRPELERTIRILGQERTSDAARAYNLLGEMLQDMEADAEGAARADERALEIATAIGDWKQTVQALHHLTFANIIACRGADAQDSISKWMDKLSAGAGPGGLAGRYLDPDIDMSYLSAGVVYSLVTSDYPRAVECLQRALAISKRIGHNPMEVRSGSRLGTVYLLMGQWDQAEGLFRSSLELAMELPECRNLVPQVQSRWAELAAHRGELTAADREILAALEAPEWFWSSHNRTAAFTVLAWVRTEAGDRQAAREALRRAFELIADHRGCGWCSPFAWVVAAHVESVNAQGDERVFRQATRWIKEKGSPFAKAQMQVIAARWRRLHGAPTEEGLEAAEAYFRGISNPFELATTLHEHALTLHALGEGDKCRGILEEALRIYSELGARKRVEDVLRSRALVEA